MLPCRTTVSIHTALKIYGILVVKNRTQYATWTQTVIFLRTADGNLRFSDRCQSMALKDLVRVSLTSCILSLHSPYPCLPLVGRCLSSVSLWPPLPLDGERARVLGLLELLMPMEALRWPCRNTSSPIQTEHQS